VVAVSNAAVINTLRDAMKYFWLRNVGRQQGSKQPA
jgi:hypothetical protein